jgi:hypothetical protein
MSILLLVMPSLLSKSGLLFHRTSRHRQSGNLENWSWRTKKCSFILNVRGMESRQPFSSSFRPWGLTLPIRPISQASWDVPVTVGILNHMAALCETDNKSAVSTNGSPGFLNYVLRESFGVTAGIIPWNVPMIMFAVCAFSSSSVPVSWWFWTGNSQKWDLPLLLGTQSLSNPLRKLHWQWVFPSTRSIPQSAYL